MSLFIVKSFGIVNDFTLFNWIFVNDGRLVMSLVMMISILEIVNVCRFVRCLSDGICKLLLPKCNSVRLVKLLNSDGNMLKQFCLIFNVFKFVRLPIVGNNDWM